MPLLKQGVKGVAESDALIAYLQQPGTVLSGPGGKLEHGYQYPPRHCDLSWPMLAFHAVSPYGAYRILQEKRFDESGATAFAR